VLLELVLLFRASMIQGIQQSSACCSFVGCLKWFILVQLMVFLLGGMPFSITSFHQLVEEGMESMSDGGLEDDVEVARTKSTLFRMFAALFGVVHIVTSVALVNLFLRPFCTGQEVIANKWLIVKVSTASLVAIISTLICYGNLGLMFANAYHLLALDSIINDVCLIVVSFSDSTEDAENAGKAQYDNPAPAVSMGNPSI